MQHALDEEASGEVDEPPDDLSFTKKPVNDFKKNVTQKPKEPSESLLTKALHHLDEESTNAVRPGSTSSRRRSINSTISLASTAELTADTGLTSPARTSTPSPPPPMFSLPRFFGIGPKPDVRPLVNNSSDAPHARTNTGATSTGMAGKDPAIEALAKKRCISFACGPKPEVKKPVPQAQSPETKPTDKVVDEQPKQRRTCIKFACAPKPAAPEPGPDDKETTPTMCRTARSATEKAGSPTLRFPRSPSISRARARRSSTPRPLPLPLSIENGQNKKYLTINHGDMSSESSRFHEFASDEPQEEDWIRQNLPVPGQRLTINDTLRKENEFSRLGKEAEDEALDELEAEEQGYVEDEEDDDDDDDDDADLQDDDDDVEDDEDDEDDDDDEDDEDDDEDDGDDDKFVYGSDGDDFEEASDGYKTDSEFGFADSDDDEGGDLELWTLSQGQLSGGTAIYRRPSLSSNHSGSSISTDMARPTVRRTRGKNQRIKIRPGTPELPDSTDFVCGTLDEDRVLEDAYLSCIAARRREKLHVIPQDIDPSFPTSEPEDEDEAPRKSQNNSDDNIWLHGELEDLHHDKARGGERSRKRTAQVSPKRYRSPPPKRHPSPAPKGRGRSPRRVASPAPVKRTVKSPPAAPMNRAETRGQRFGHVSLGPNPVAQTKSLPRASGIFPQHLKASRRGKHVNSSAHGAHVRGAIDIVKGLEQKRQRRKEKFKEKYFHKHCNRARKGQTHEKRPQPGQGAERMREVGLLMAGKRGPGQFVLSV